MRLPRLRLTSLPKRGRGRSEVGLEPSWLHQQRALRRSAPSQSTPAAIGTTRGALRGS